MVPSLSRAVRSVGGWVAQEARARERRCRGTWSEKKRNAGRQAEERTAASPPMESKKLRRGSSGANEGSGGVFCLVSTVLLSLLVAVAMLYSIKMFGAGIELALNGAVALLMAICMSNGCNCCLKQVPRAAFCTISHPCRRALTPNSPFPLRRTLASLRSGRVPRGWR